MSPQAVEAGAQGPNDLGRRLAGDFPHLRAQAYLDHAGATVPSRALLDAVHRASVASFQPNPHRCDHTVAPKCRAARRPGARGLGGGTASGWRGQWLVLGWRAGAGRAARESPRKRQPL